MILDKFPRALFFPCSNHALNLVVNDAAKCSQEVNNFFTTVQGLYNFFSESPKRWALLQTHATNVKGIILKNLWDTRWLSRTMAMKCLNENLPEIYDALIEITENSKFDKNSEFKANELGKRIFNFKFVLSTVIWHELLSRISIVSKVLQSNSMDFGSCLSHLRKFKEYFQKMRTDESSYQTLYSKAENISSTMNICVNFAIHDTMSLRSTRYQTENSAKFNPKEKYKIDFFFYIIDVRLNSLEDRFEQFEMLDENFGFLSDI